MGRYRAFDPARHESELAAIIAELESAEHLAPRDLDRVLRRHPKEGRGAFSKAEIIRGYRHLARRRGTTAEEEKRFLARLRMKPVRTLSGVAPVTVLTRPHPCPGTCIFCPSDVRMPKSYLASEPGAQRAAGHAFDPYLQTYFRLRAYHNIGHPTAKVELILLGGTWSSYPESYQLWFLTRCFEAMNDFGRRAGRPELDPRAESPPGAADFARPDETVDARGRGATYNEVVSRLLRGALPGDEHASWEDLSRAQRANETAGARCVGLVVETRPDHLPEAEVARLRRQGATKVQIGYQSLSDRVLALNRRGHDVAATRRAMALLRRAGFKIHAHWMPNLYGSSPAADVEDFQRLFTDPGFRPDELKIYPCSLVATAELNAYHEDGRWRPYSRDELLDVLTACMAATPPYCRLTRVIRDIPSQDILAGNKATNFRQMAEAELARRGLACRDIRAREIRGRGVRRDELRRDEIGYDTAVSRELFLQYVTGEDRLAAFLRLSLPSGEGSIPEIAASALIREVHVYGALQPLGERRSGRAQHSGLGRALVRRAAEIARGAGFRDLAVISAVGTRPYYRRLGFADGELYQHLGL